MIRVLRPQSHWQHRDKRKYNEFSFDQRFVCQYNNEKTLYQAVTAVTFLVLSFDATTVVAQDDMPAFPPAKVEVAVAELREMAPVVEVSGTVLSLNDSRIAAEVEGVLTWMADVGDAVKAGQVIARIDPRLLQVAVKRAGQMLHVLKRIIATVNNNLNAPTNWPPAIMCLQICWTNRERSAIRRCIRWPMRACSSNARKVISRVPAFERHFRVM